MIIQTRLSTHASCQAQRQIKALDGEGLAGGRLKRQPVESAKPDPVEAQRLNIVKRIARCDATTRPANTTLKAAATRRKKLEKRLAALDQRLERKAT